MTALPTHDDLIDAWTGIVRRGVRSALALLGLVVGAASVVAMISISHNARVEALKNFQQMGTEVFLLEIQESTSSHGAITPESMEALRSKVPGLALWVPISTLTLRPVDSSSPVGQILAVTPEFTSLMRLRILNGRQISALDEGQPFAIVGADFPTKLLRHHNNKLQILTSPQRFTVIGALHSMPASVLLPVDLNNAAIISYGSSRRLTAGPQLNLILGRATAGHNPALVAAASLAALSKLPGAPHMQAHTARQLIEVQDQQIRIYTRLLIGTAIVALLVGSVGVANVMLIGVLERRREIGIRMAIGASPQDVRNGVLAEALILSSTGGLFGILLGLASAMLFALGNGWSFALSWAALPAGIISSFVVGIVASLYPARIAMSVEPMEALRAF